MVIVTSGKTPTGEDCQFYMDGRMKFALDRAISRVKKYNWDYVCLVCGLPGSGKSTLARIIAKYCCPWFDETYIAFKDKAKFEGDTPGFIELTSNCKEYSAVVLDESFQSLNSRVSMTGDFLRIINHLQIIRQKHLFIILCLPNFFDLSKGISIFRSSHLFVTYATDEGKRGRFLAFGRDKKRSLFIKGAKYINYNAERSNFSGRFVKANNILDENRYEKLKHEHLLEQQREIDKKDRSYKTVAKDLKQRNEICIRLRKIMGWTYVKIGKLAGLSESQIRKIERIYDETGKAPDYTPESD